MIYGCDSLIHEPQHIHAVNSDLIKSRIQLSPAESEWLASHREVRVRLGQWPPFMITGSGASGISIDYLDLVSRIHGLKFTYLTEKDISWSDALEGIRNRQIVDMVPAIQPTKDRDEFMIFSSIYQILPWVIVTRSDADFISDLDDLTGKTVSIQKYFILHKSLEAKYPELKLEVIDTPTPTLDSLKAVAAGRSQATVNALPVITYFIRKYGLSNLKIAAPAKFKDLQLAMGIRKDWPELAGILSKTFAAMSRQDVAAINYSWLSVGNFYGIAPHTVLIWTVVAAVIVGLIFLTFITINCTLKKKVEEKTRDLNQELQERIRAEAGREESEEKFRFLVENCPVPMALEDRQGNLKYFNPCFIKTFGYTLKDFPTLEVGFLHSYPDPEYRAEVVDQWTKAVIDAENKGDIIRREDIAFTCRDGRILNIDIIGMQVGEDIMTVFIDQTGRKQADQLMVQTEKMLSVGGLAAGMAHEINNPLGIILSSVQNFKRRTDPEKDKNAIAAEASGTSIRDVSRYLEQSGANNYLNYIQEAAQRSGEIIRNMLDFARQNDDVRTDCTISNILDKAIGLASSDYDLKKHYDFKTIEIIRDYQPEISKVSVVRNEIEQVFLNILKNSAQAISKAGRGKETPRIILRTFEDKQWVTTEISDNGPGMTITEQKRAFEPFFTTKSPGEGTGLGLSVSYFIITRNHKGEIELNSSTEHGTTFAIKLPKKKVDN
ncbi:ATP-binding protein [Maridesulfovibrio sp. FT414]|uniref:ATP-binding protein n=1 Tax=Maridesulfovibrio sp. FT414 TaxID=2979469 RepID=UPI003D80174D